MQAKSLFFYLFKIKGKAIPWLLPIFLSASLQASPKSDPLRFAKDFEKFAELDKVNPPPAKNLTLFTGSSTIRRWTTLPKDFPEIPVLNRGFGGSQLNQVLHHFDDLFPRYKPVRIVLYCGENDLWDGKTVEKALTEFTTLVTRIRKVLPNTPLIYLSCKPSPKRMSKWKTYQELNGKIRTHCEKDQLLTFVDLSTILLGPDGKPAPGIWDKDDLHVNQAGYDRMTKLLAPLLSPK
jgi:lysophospholipase L1-like esterase